MVENTMTATIITQEATTTINTTEEAITTTNTTEEATTIITTTEVATTTATTTANIGSNGSVPNCVTGTYPSFDTDLLALWRFDNSANDDKGLHNGTRRGDAAFLSGGYINGDLSLVGSASSYVKTTYIDLTSSSFTIELWIRIEYFSGTNMMLVSQNDLTLRISDGGIVFISGTPPSVGTQLVINKWYHIALVFNNNLLQQQIYVNGKLDSTSAVDFNFAANSIFYIGTLDENSEFFNGEIDHLSITTRVKSACEILRDASLLASYSFTAPSPPGTDSGPYGNNGYLSGSGDRVQGVIGDAIMFDGNSIYFQVSGLTALTTTNSEFSFTLFIQPANISDCSLIFLSGTSDISDSYQARPYLGISSSGNLLAELPPSLFVGAPMNIPVNQWSHVAFTYSFPNDRVSLYYNGVLQTSVPGPSPMYYNPSVTTPPLYVTLGHPLGGPNGSVIRAQPFTGNIDEFTMWSRELNASEVAAAATVS